MISLRTLTIWDAPKLKQGLEQQYTNGKIKVAQSSSYKRITVTPQIWSILDQYIDPLAEGVFQPVQSSNQNGFTRNISYLVGAMLRG